MQLRRLPDRPDRQNGMIDVVGHRLDLRIARVLGRGVDRDAVDGQAIWPSRNALLLDGSSQDSVPARRSVELLGVFERGDRLRAVDDDLVLVVDDLAAERPQQPMAPAVGVADGVAEREAAGLALLRPAPAPIFRIPARSVGHPRSRPPSWRNAVVDASPGRTQRERDPLPVALAVLPATRIPAAIFLAEIFGDVRHVDQLLGILVGVVVPAMMMSGPAPTFAATAAFGRRSSQPCCRPSP